MLFLIAVLHKASKVHNTNAVTDKSEAVAEVVSGMRSFAQLGSSISNLCIYLGIVMPHWQLLGALAVLNCAWMHTISAIAECQAPLLHRRRSADRA
jgi:hypothetical protein